jgi:hypothetical protein
MKATEFEMRHRGLLHFLLITAAFLTYLKRLLKNTF